MIRLRRPIRSALTCIFYVLLAFMTSASAAQSGGASADSARPRLVSQATRTGHAGAAAVSPDNRLLVTAGALWSVETGKEIRRIPHGDLVTFSPDGRLLLSYVYEQVGDQQVRSVRMWEVETGKNIQRFAVGGRGMASATFSPDGRAVATVDADGVVRLWSVETGEELPPSALPSYGQGRVWTSPLSPDGRHVALFEHDGVGFSVAIRSIETGNEVQRFRGPSPSGRHPAPQFSPDGRYVVTANEIVQVWSMETGKEVQRFEGSFPAYTAAFSPDGRYIAASSDPPGMAGGRGTPGGMGVQLWSFDSGERVSRFAPGTHSGFRFSPDGRFVATTSWNSPGHPVQLWDVETGNLVQSFDGRALEATAVEFAHDGRILVAGHGTARLWSPEQGEEIRRFDGLFTGAHAFSSEVDRLVTHSGSEAWVWDVEAGEMQGHFAPEDGSDGSWRVWTALSPDGRRAALTVRADTTVRIWNVEKGEEVMRLQHENPASGLAFSPAGRSLAAVSNSRYRGTIRVWDVDTGEEVGRLGGTDWSCVEATARDSVLLTYHGSSRDRFGTLRAWSIGSQSLRWQASDRIRNPVVTPVSDESCLAVSPDGRLVAAVAEDGTVPVWDVASGRERYAFDGHSGEVFHMVFSPDGRYFATSDELQTHLWSTEDGSLLRKFDGGGWILFSHDSRILTQLDRRESVLRVWDVQTGEIVRGSEVPDELNQTTTVSPDGRFALVGTRPDGRAFQGILFSLVDTVEIARFQTDAFRSAFDIDAHGRVLFSPDSRLVAAVESDSTTRVWDTATGDVVLRLAGVVDVSFSPDGQRLAVAQGHGPVRILALRAGREVRRLRESACAASKGGDIAFSSDGRIVTSYCDGRHLIWSSKTGTLLHEAIDQWMSTVFSAAFSSDGRHLAAGDTDGRVHVWSMESGTKVQRLEHEGEQAVHSTAFSRDGDFMVTSSSDGTARVWSLETGEELRRFNIEAAGLSAAASMSPDNRFLVTDGDGMAHVWSMETGNELARLLSFDNGSWAVVTPEGRFDTNDLERMEEIVWVMPDEPLTTLPVEAFMRDFYEPRLLPRVLDGETFPDVGSLMERNRVQPRVGITAAEIATDGTASVSVEVASVQRAYGGRKRTSEVHDVHVFRDGQLVAWADGQVVGDTDSTTLRFDGLALPSGADTVQFSAYAFNSDRVKSRTSYASLAPPEATRPRRERRAYVVSIGIDRFADPAWNLKFAAADAWAMQEALTDRLEHSGRFDAVVSVPLVSGTASGSTDARKATFRAVFDLLAGRAVEPALRDRIPHADRLERATPDDLVIITAATHGYTDSSGDFFLFPQDIETGSSAGITPELLASAISSDELSAWLRGVDAEEMVMIVDACHAAAAVEGSGFKPGPMGSRGLGQLAYDKGMRILTATQSADVALESENLKQGLLTFALVRNGLEAFRADADGDGRILMKEWLSYGEERVPDLYEEMLRGDVQTFGHGGRGVKVEGEVKDQGFVQRPALFDFRRQGRPIILSR